MKLFLYIFYTRGRGQGSTNRILGKYLLELIKLLKNSFIVDAEIIYVINLNLGIILVLVYL